jgi:hypothetical protein
MATTTIRAAKPSEPDSDSRPTPAQRLLKTGDRNGVEIKVIVDSNGNVITAYPLGGKGVTRNDAQGNPQPIN